MCVDACDTEIEHQCHGCYVFHWCLLLSGGDHSERLVLLPPVQAEADAKSGHAFGIFFVPRENGLSIDAPSAEITNLLKAWSSGDEAALARLAEHVYPELRLMARRYMKNEAPGQHPPGHRIGP